MLRTAILALPLMMLSSTLYAQGYSTPVDVTVDTGSHTCTSIGQEKKVYKDVYVGDSRYFVDDNLSEVSLFGAGGCEYNSDGGGNAHEMQVFCVTDADGQPDGAGALD